MKRTLLLSSVGAVALAVSLQALPGTASAETDIRPAKAALDYCNPVWSALWGVGKFPARDARGNVVRHRASEACPAPEAAAPPPPPPATEFLVFFDWDKSNITPEAAEFIAGAASAAQTMGATGVSVVGHTDTSGNVRYNQRLSERRAANTASALVSNGIPAGSITTEGRGETELLVPTGDGVREPSNRRAEIDLLR